MLGDVAQADRRRRASATTIRRALDLWNSRSSLTRLSVVLPTTKPPASCTCSRAKASLMSWAVIAMGGHAVGQQVDADGAVAAPAEAHLADAVDGLQALLDHVDGVLVELLLGAVALQRQPHDRLGVGLDLGDHRRVDILGQRRSTWLTLACTSLKATSTFFSGRR
jgi:hypothetical protein